MPAPIHLLAAFRAFASNSLGVVFGAGLTWSAHAALVLSGGGLTLVEQGGTFAAGNLAGFSTGAIPFSSSDLGPELGIPFHRAVNLNDETYGNSDSWIGGVTHNPYPRPFAGISLDSAQSLQSIAFGRDNLGSFSKRSLGLYELQYTRVAGPGASTPDASWTTIGTLDYQSAGGGNFDQPSLRHRFNFTQVDNVTGVRLLVPGTGIGSGTAIDEIELYVVPLPRITRIHIDGNRNAIIEHNGTHTGRSLFVQENPNLACLPFGLLSCWTNRPSGPHASPYNAGPAIGTRFFRLHD